MSKALKIESLFNVAATGAATWLTAQEHADGAASKASEALAMFMNATVDAARAAGVTRDQKGATFVATLVTENQTILDALAEGLVLPKTMGEYARGAQRAFFHGVPWTAGLKNNPEMMLPWATKKAQAENRKASKGKVVKAATTSPSRDGLDTTAHALLAQARALGLHDLAADLLDLLIDRLDGFSEATM